MGQLADAWKFNRGLTALAVVSLVVFVVSAGMSVAYDTTFNNVPVWNKPVKFALSFGAFAPAMIWIARRVPTRSRWLGAWLEILGWALVNELLFITLQAFRGVDSHWNTETSLDEAILGALFVGLSVFIVASIVVGVLLARHNLGDGPVAVAMKAAVVIMIVGAFSAFLIEGPEPADVAANAGVGGHGPAGGPGIPIVGWSTDHGGFRVPHFVGLHGLQVLPLAGVAIASFATRDGSLPLGRQRRAMWLVAAAYLGLWATVLIHTLRDLPVTAPDGLAVGLFTALVVVPLGLALSQLGLGAGPRLSTAAS